MPERRPYHERSYPLRSSIHRASHYYYHESSKRRMAMQGKCWHRRVWSGIVARWLEVSKARILAHMDEWTNEEENEENEEREGQSEALDLHGAKPHTLTKAGDNMDEWTIVSPYRPGRIASKEKRPSAKADGLMCRRLKALY